MTKRSAAILALCLPLAVVADTKPDTKSGDFPGLSESVTVAVTNVEVVVTDSKGNRVKGLRKEDFQVFEDGVPQPLTNFFAVTGGRTALDDGTEISLAEEPKTPDEIPATLKAKYIIYVDNLNIEPIHRTRVFKSVFEFIEKAVGPNSEAMVVTQNRSLKVRQRFTSDKGIIIGALEQIMGETGGGTTAVSERNEALKNINDAKTESEAIYIAKQAARSLDDDLRYAIDGLKNTINTMSGLDGRKTLVYISDGLPEMVGQDLFDTVQTKFRGGAASMEGLAFDRVSSYASIVREANSQGVTIYAIDAAGLQVEEAITAEYGKLENRPSVFLQQRNYQAPLQTLARETGGLAAINTNNPTKEFEELARDFSDFYSLGYRSTRGGVDRPHQIQIKVAKTGLRARYRSGYMEKTVETRTAESVTAALYYPRTDNPAKFTILVGEAKGYDSANYLVPVKMSIPLASVTLVPDGDTYRGRLYLYFVVLDSLGQQSDLQIRPLDIKLDPKSLDSARKKDYAYDVQLIMVPGAQMLSVAVRDGVSGSVSYAQKGVFVSVLPAEKKKAS